MDKGKSINAKNCQFLLKASSIIFQGSIVYMLESSFSTPFWGFILRFSIDFSRANLAFSMSSFVKRSVLMKYVVHELTPFTIPIPFGCKNEESS